MLGCGEEGIQLGCLWVFEEGIDFVGRICYVVVVAPRDLKGR